MGMPMQCEPQAKVPAPRLGRTRHFVVSGSGRSVRLRSNYNNDDTLLRTRDRRVRKDSEKNRVCKSPRPPSNWLEAHDPRCRHMSRNPFAPVLNSVRRALGLDPSDQSADVLLLERFARTKDEEAFA